ncbi:MAG: hypothetical protein RXR16_03535 [Thermocladium sp.]
MKTEIRINDVTDISIKISKGSHQHEFLVKYVRGDGYYACSDLLEQELGVKCIKLLNTIKLGDATIRFRGMSAILFQGRNKQTYVGMGNKSLPSSELLLIRLGSTLASIQQSRVRRWGALIKSNALMNIKLNINSQVNN